MFYFLTLDAAVSPDDQFGIEILDSTTAEPIYPKHIYIRHTHLYIFFLFYRKPQFLNFELNFIVLKKRRR